MEQTRSDKYEAKSMFDVICLIERFSIECRETKTKVITLANQKEHRQYSGPIKTRSDYR